MLPINRKQWVIRVFLAFVISLGLIFAPLGSRDGAIAAGFFNRPPSSAPGSSPLKSPSKPSSKSTKVAGKLTETSPPEDIQALRQELEVYQPQVTISSPRPDEVLQDNTVSVRFQVQDLPIFKDEKLGLGPHLHVFLDSQGYQAVYDVSQPLVLKDLNPGTHTLRAFASRPWHESFKNEGAYAQVTFHVFTKTGENRPQPELPLLTYSRPQGSYGAEPIMLDFYLTNAPLHLVAQEDTKDDIADWRIRCTVNGESFVLDRWQPLYLKGFKPGKNWVQLEYLDEQGNLVGNVFNNTARIINYDPNGKDTLSKLTRGELTVAEARGIVDPTYKPKPAEPKAESKPAPSPAPAPKTAPPLKPVPSAPVAPVPAAPKPAPIVPETPSPKPTPTPEVKPSLPEKAPESVKPTPAAPPPSEKIAPAETSRPGKFFDRFRKPEPSPTPVATPAPSPTIAPAPSPGAIPTPPPNEAKPEPKSPPAPKPTTGSTPVKVAPKVEPVKVAPKVEQPPTKPVPPPITKPEVGKGEAIPKSVPSPAPVAPPTVKATPTPTPVIDPRIAPPKTEPSSSEKKE